MPTKDFDRNIVIENRTMAVARKVTEFLTESGDRFAKTIVFCVDIDHAERMRQALAALNSDLVLENYKYVMRITGDSEEGKRELENFQNPEESYPVIATTSKLMTTGIDVQTCKLIVLDANIGSMTEFKQIIGRGTRINEEYGKSYFTIIDFRNVTELFADPAFDGDPVRIRKIDVGEEFGPEDLGVEVEDGGNPPGSGAGPIPAPEPEDPAPYGFEEPPGPTEAKEKQVVAGVEVSILNTRIQTLGPDGKLITESLRDYTKKSILGEYRSLDAFLAHWKDADKKQAIIDELAAKGIVREDLLQETKRDLDLFDLVCHIAWGAPALTRRERTENVKKRDYFAKYGDKARAVLEVLLDRYAEGGIEEIEDINALRLEPLSAMGTLPELLGAFGGREGYLEAVKDLEAAIYRAA